MLGFLARMDLTPSVSHVTQSCFKYFKLLLCCIIPNSLTLFAPFIFVVNLGGLLLQALLEFWPRTRINPMDEEENEVNHGKNVTNYPLPNPNLC